MQVVLRAAKRFKIYNPRKLKNIKKISKLDRDSLLLSLSSRNKRFVMTAKNYAEVSVQFCLITLPFAINFLRDCTLNQPNLKLPQKRLCLPHKI